MLLSAYACPFFFNFTAFSPQEITKSMFAANNQNKITTEKGPVMLLYELFTDISFNCVQTVGPQHAKFKTLVTVNGLNQFEGTGELQFTKYSLLYLN